jgi:hypothetical protein
VTCRTHPYLACGLVVLQAFSQVVSISLDSRGSLLIHGAAQSDKHSNTTLRR